MLDPAVFNAMFATSAQLQDIQSALLNAGLYATCEATTTGLERECWQMRKFAYLNRACELACAPLAQYYAESSNGALDLVWITYRPEAILDNPESIPSALVYLDTVDNLTEDQARARALGY